jgi:hypothetical protein
MLRENKLGQKMKLMRNVKRMRKIKNKYRILVGKLKGKDCW